MPKDTRSYGDRRDYLAKVTNERRRRLKRQMVEYKGKKCQLCGYSKYIGTLDFHHIDPETKIFKLSMDELYRSWETTKAEVDKCILVCANCHREVHGGVLQIPQSMNKM